MIEDIEGINVLHKLFYIPIENALKTPKKKDGAKKASKKKIEGDSLFITLMNMTENNLLKLLEDCSVKDSLLSSAQRSLLLKNEWIRGGTTAGTSFITAKGLWKVESDLEYISPEKLVEYIDKKKFGVKLGKPMNDEEKVVLFLFIALRSYSPEIQIHRDKANPEIFINIFDECVDFLKKTQSIKESFHRTEEKSGEDPITYILRRAGNTLPTKTRNIFQIAPRANYLNIYDPDTGKVSVDDLSYLLWKIFGGNLTMEQEYDIRDFCNKHFNSHMNDIYPPEMQNAFLEFTKSQYANLIPKALEEIIERKQNWEMMDNL